MVSVEVDPNRFDGSKAIHVFHIKEDGSVAQIPDEDVTGIASEGDGRISRVEFYTDSFSDFLLSDAEDLVVPAVTAPEVVEDLSAVSKDSEESSGAIIIAVIAVVILIPAAILAVVFLKKRKKTGPNE